MWAGPVALVILAIMFVSYLFKGSSQSFGAAVDCGSNTCLQGGFGLTTGPFQVDGNSIFNGNVTMTGTPAITGNLALTGSLTVTGTTTLAGLTSVDPTFGMQIFPTSTATRVCMTVAATTTASAVSNTGLTSVFTYGACN